MLTAETKRKIDYLRDVLVGKIPVPSLQIEQITLGLIYKFMSDIDEQNEGLGGKSFFSGEYKKYSWKNIMDRSLAGHERVLFYSEGLEKMGHNDKIPQLFRDIFKGAFLPFKDPAILDLFLKGINEFKYANSEELGNAFEYLLSTAASQGDAGQFRTPRHIIDFIVEVVDPQKEDKILDPACGTAGFLVSAYKHILKNNTDKKSGKPGSLLTATERKKLTKNIVGYDISHEMVRLSLVNLYLHGFAEPSIYEYDTLSSLDRWDDNFDCLLANPPFMTPRGGIKPHNRFPIQAKRSEVLFVDYITEHLTSNGKAGIIVPEGIIFQSGNAYKQLRKMLVEDGLWAVVSLPQGVFNPYAGVKTSILFFNNTIARQTKEILFVKVESDGFDLGAQRRPIDKNDLPTRLEVLKKYKKAVQENKKFSLTKTEEKFASVIKKEKIAENGEYNLSADRYLVPVDYTNAKWTMIKLGEFIEFLQKSNRRAGDGVSAGKYPFFTSGQNQNKWLDVADYREESLILGTGGSASVHISIDFSTSADVFVIKSNSGELNNKFLYHCLKNNIDILNSGFRGVGLKHLSKEYLKRIQVPLPPIEVQQQIVAELDGYRKIIDGANQIIDNYKPVIEANNEWVVTDFGNDKVVKIIDGDRGKNYPPKSEFQKSGHCVFLNTKNVTQDGFVFDKIDFISKERDGKVRKGKLQKEDVILTTRGTVGNSALNDESVEYDHIRINSGMVILRPNTEKVMPAYLLNVVKSKDVQDQFRKIRSGSAQPQLPIRSLIEVEFSLPSLETQKKIVARIEEEQKIIEANKKLIKLFGQKIKDKISDLLGR